MININNTSKLNSGETRPNWEYLQIFTLKFTNLTFCNNSVKTIYYFLPFINVII